MFFRYCGLVCEVLKIDSVDWWLVVVYDGWKGSIVFYFKILGYWIGYCER